MALGGLAPVVRGRMDGVMARVERGGELLQRSLLARALGTFEQDDRAAAVGDLGQLQLAEMLAQRGERRMERLPTRRLQPVRIQLGHRAK